MTTPAPSFTESLVDSHCHLQDRRFDEDREAVLEAARRAGVSRILLVGSDPDDNPRGLELAERHEELYATAGIHPHDAAAIDETLWNKVRKWAEHPRVVAIGETGLDYHYMHSPAERQREAFRQHIELARERNLPLVVHSREASAETMDLLEEHGRDLRGVLHCFSGDRSMADRTLKLGFFISIAGPVTFKKAGELREIVRSVPIERLLIETDAPYLAPVPHRGRRNEPAYVADTAREVARIKGLSADDVARITSLNAHRLFGLGAPTASRKIAYPIRNALYLNITNRCSNRCGFCVRARDAFVKGHNLRLDEEPSASEIRDAAGDPTRWQEVVFCGYGEPLLRLDVVREVAVWLKERGVRIRMNTNGQGRLIQDRDVLADLDGLVDTWSVSLNAPTQDEYDRICRPEDPRAWLAMLAFIRDAVARGTDVVATVVDLPGLDVEACRRLAAEMGARFRVRAYNDLG